MANLGTVVAINGVASVVDENGNKRPLHLGDILQPGETVLTPPGVIVDLQLVNGRKIQIEAEQTVKLTQELSDSIPPDSADSSVDQASIQAVIKAVGEGKDISDVLDDTAAGLAASSPSYGFGFVNLLRITEGVTPINYEYNFNRDAPITVIAADSTVVPVIINGNNAITAKPDTNWVQEDSFSNNENAPDHTVATGNVLQSINHGGSPNEGVFGDNADTQTGVPGTLTTSLNGNGLGTYGTLIMGADGSYTYLLANNLPNVQALSQNQKAEEVFTYTVTNGTVTTTETLTISVFGTNDSPVITTTEAQNQGTVTEAGNLVDGTAVPGTPSVTGTLASTDVDNNATATWTGDKAGTYGSFAIDPATGVWVYTLNNAPGSAADKLAEGEVKTETFTATVTDDKGATATQLVTVTVNGTNDSPVITTTEGQSQGKVTEAGNLDDGTAAPGTPSVTGTLASTDVDNNATATWTGDKAGNYGSFAIDPATGVWVYTLNNAPGSAADKLAEGEVKTETFTATVTDDKGATATQLVTVTVNGTNDSPVITTTEGQNQGTVTEAGNLDDGTAVPGTPSVTGTLASTDVDNNATATWTGDKAGTYGSFAIDPATGVWVYTLNNAPGSAADKLAEGEVKTETFTATVTDDKGATATQLVTVTVNGTNDSPVISTSEGQNQGTVTEAGNLDDGTAAPGTPSVTGTLASTDVDNNATAIWTGDKAGTYGSFAIDATTGKWTYQLDNTLPATQALKEGEVKTETFKTTVTDDFGATATQTVTITINGTNDNPLITTNPGDGPKASTGNDLINEAGISTIGSHAGDGSNIAHGNFSLSDPDGFVDIHTLSINGTEVAVNDLVSHGLFTVDHGTLSIDNYNAATGQGTYTYSLTSPLTSSVPAANNGTNIVNNGVNIDLIVKDTAGLTASTTIHIDVQDDVPLANNSSSSVTESGGPGTVDVAVIVDVSGSMTPVAGGSIPTFNQAGFSSDRIGLAMYSMQQLLLNHTEIQNVQITKFDDSASSTTWMTRTAALTYVADAAHFTGGGATDYDLALTTEMAAFSASPRPAGASSQTVAYFLSDGAPNPTNSGIDTDGSGSNVSIAAWENFVTTNSISNVFAIGLGSDVNTNNLAPISYPNTASGSAIEDNVVVLAGDNLTVLTQTIDNLLTGIVSTQTGNIFTDGVIPLPTVGADGGHILSIAINGTTYSWNGVTGSGSVITEAGSINSTISGTTSITNITTGLGGKLTFYFATDGSGQAGGYNYVAPASGVTSDTTEHFAYTLVDGDGDQSTANLNITVLDSVPIAYDNFNQAMVQTVPVADTVTNTVLADFSINRNSANSGPGYNPWVFDTSGTGKSVVDLGSSTIATAVASNSDKWVVSTLNGNSLDASVSGSTLQLVDSNGHSSGAAKLLTPVIAIGSSGSSTLSFDVTMNNTNGNDSVTWSLYKNISGTWTPQTGLGNSGTISSDGTVTTGVLGSGQYRVFINANDGGGNSNLTLNLDNFSSHVTTHNPDQVQGTIVSGNVLTDPNSYIASSDLWGAVDSKGADGATLNVWNGLAYVAAASAGTIVHGTYGDLSIHSDGFYTYTPTTPSLSDIGHIDSFSYKLIQPDGDSDTANLVIKISDSLYTPITPIQGDDNANVLTGTSGDDVILGKGGDDNLIGAAGNDHLEGGAGQDTLIGGAGNDTLTGGTGLSDLVSDTFKWSLNDRGTTTTPAHDVVTDFNTAPITAGGDVLNLKDLLIDEHNGATAGVPSNLENYLHFDKSGTDTTISISSTGGFSGGVISGHVDQTITLIDVDLVGSNTQQQIIADMLANQKLITDH
jgi:VCBS repeat-containing protein